MPKDPNAKIQKAINKKLLDAKDWRVASREARRRGDLRLAEILEGKARQADTERLNLQAKLK